MNTPPPPPPKTEMHTQAPTPRSEKSAENYNPIQNTKTAAQTLPANYVKYTVGCAGYSNSIPDKRSKHTNRLHKRKQAKLRAKRNGR